MDIIQKNPKWYVLLIGGHSVVGKTIVSKRIGLSLGVPWMQAEEVIGEVGF